MLTDNPNRVLTITPQEVIEFFENSDDLRAMASDVRAVLGNSETGQISAPESKLEADLEQVFEAGLDVNASKADIAEVLTSKRAWGGDAMRKRLDRIQNLLTMAQKAIEVQPEVKRAA